MALSGMNVDADAAIATLYDFKVEVDEVFSQKYKDIAPKIIQKALPMVPVHKGKLVGSLKASGTKRYVNARAGTPTRVPHAATAHWGRKRFPNPRPGGTERQYLSKHQPFFWLVAYPSGRKKDGVAPWIQDELVEAMNKVVKKVNVQLARGLKADGIQGAGL